METFNGLKCLFLDRDGVINIEKENAYILNRHELVLYENTIAAFQIFKTHFDKIFVVTNQRGIGKGLMSHEDLHDIHYHLQEQLQKVFCQIDQFYYAPDLDDHAELRKPNIGMGLKAKADFPQIDFQKSIMVGNNLSDMQFGKQLGMKTIFLTTTQALPLHTDSINEHYPTLYDFAKSL